MTKMKYIGLDRHCLKEKINGGIKEKIDPTDVCSKDQAVAIFTEGLPGPVFQKMTSNLKMENICTNLAGKC